MRAVYLGSDDGADLLFATPQDALDAFRQVRNIGSRVWGVAVDDERSRVVVELEPPRSWHKFQQRYFDHFFGTSVAEVRGLFGLTASHLLGEADIPEAVAETVHEQVWPSGVLGVGDLGNGRFSPVATLRYPDPAERFGASVLVYVGKATDYRPLLDASPDPAGAYDRATRLFRLWSTVNMLHVLTSISELDAVRYILSGSIPMVPWVDAGGTEADGYGQVQVIVGSLDVRPEEVAAAYSKVRRRLMGGFDTRWAFTRSAPTSEERVRFCHPLRQMDKPMPWNDIVARWNSKHPDNTYQDGDTLSRVYRRDLDTIAKGGETQ
jgi:hypothetical protein